MALTGASLKFLKKIVDRIDGEVPDQRRVLALGYPDIVASPEAIRKRFGFPPGVPLRTRPDSDSIVKWHGAQAVTDRIVETSDVFDALDLELEIIDIVASRGDEVIVDLNEPVAPHYRERYALVIDHGTCEHCFNVAQALKNVATMTVAGGYVFQSNPLNMYNHGFYNINPTCYHDFYGANGFEIIDLLGIHKDPFDPELLELPPTQRFTTLPEGSSSVVVARRKEVRDIVWPKQTKYLNYPTLRG